MKCNAAAVAGILVAATTASAGPLEVEIGPSAVVFDTPHASRETIGAVAITAAFHVDPQVPIGIRMHLAIGGLGLALDVRVGYAFGPVTIAAFALPTWVFASEGSAREGRLRSLVEAGITVGRAL